MWKLHINENASPEEKFECVQNLARQEAEQIDPCNQMARRVAVDAQDRWVDDYNKSHRRVEFEVGDLVLRPNVVLSSAADHYNKDLAAPRVGPFEIVEKLSPTTFRLCNPATGAILKGSWNITKLRPYI